MANEGKYPLNEMQPIYIHLVGIIILYIFATPLSNNYDGR